MEEVSSATLDPIGILGALAESIIDLIRTAMHADHISVIHPIAVGGNSSEHLSMHSTIHSCKISIGRKPVPPGRVSGSSRLRAVQKYFCCASMDIYISRGTIEIVRRATGGESASSSRSSSSWVQRWNDEEGLSTPSSLPAPPMETLRLVMERLDAGVRGFERLLKSRIVGDNTGFRYLEIVCALHGVEQMKGALSRAMDWQRIKRKRGTGAMEGVKSSVAEDSEEYREILRKMKELGWSEMDVEEPESMDIVKRMKNLMQ